MLDSFCWAMSQFLSPNGFVYCSQKEKTHVKTTYAQNPKSMLRYEYESVFFVCRKPALDDDRSPSQTGGR
jgi:hypothetical protein